VNTGAVVVGDIRGIAVKGVSAGRDTIREERMRRSIQAFRHRATCLDSSPLPPRAHPPCGCHNSSVRGRANIQHKSPFVQWNRSTSKSPLSFPSRRTINASTASFLDEARHQRDPSSQPPQRKAHLRTKGIREMPKIPSSRAPVHFASFAHHRITSSHPISPARAHPQSHPRTHQSRPPTNFQLTPTALFTSSLC
jgi:hypothetical protein